MRRVEKFREEERVQGDGVKGGGASSGGSGYLLLDALSPSPATGLNSGGRCS